MTTVIIIYTKDLVTAVDQCTETQFATPFFPGESCEDISTIRIHRTITHQDIIGFLMDPVEFFVQ